MSQNTNDLKIKDDEFIFAEKIMHAYLDTLTEVISDYYKVLDKVSAASLNDILITNKLIQLKNKIAGVNSALLDVSKMLENKAKIFIEDVDKKDGPIY